MPRRPRVQTAGYLYHVLNRGAGRQTLFVTDADYDAFERVLEQTADRGLGVAILAYGVMPNHCHPVLRPEQDDSLSEFMRLLTVTHAQRWHAHRHSAGTGPVYQGRFKSFPIQEDRHAAMVLRYAERNPLRANLVNVRLGSEWRGRGWLAKPPPGGQCGEHQHEECGDESCLPRFHERSATTGSP